MSPIFLSILLATSSSTRALWQDYHRAGDMPGRELAWARLIEAGWSFDYAATLAALRKREYPHDVPTGELRLARTDLDGRRYRTTVLIPTTYDPTRSYPLQVVLHGSTRRPAWRADEAHWRALDPFRSEEMITVFPAAWEDAMWWSDAQIENLRAILDRLRADYHIDSNRCWLTGLSDGGTGTFYHALRAPTPWAAYLPLIGHPWVLGNEQEGADGDIFAGTLLGRALLIVNGKDDRLYPAHALQPYLELFERAGARFEFKTMPGGHDVRWWPQEAENFRRFRDDHPRDPFPDHLRWESGDPARSGRAFWVVLDRLGDQPAPDPDPLNTVLFPELDPPTRAQAFPRSGPSGSAELRHDGNRVRVQTHNLRELTLLLGVDEFDFTRPIEVELNGERTQYDVTPSLETLIAWSQRDGDPALLIAAELRLSPR